MQIMSCSSTNIQLFIHSFPTRRSSDLGIFGDILCARMHKRGAAALVTDGVVRDLAGVLGTGLPVWCQGAAAPPSVAGLDRKSTRMNSSHLVISYAIY